MYSLTCQCNYLKVLWMDSLTRFQSSKILWMDSLGYRRDHPNVVWMDSLIYLFKLSKILWMGPLKSLYSFENSSNGFTDVSVMSFETFVERICRYISSDFWKVFERIRWHTNPTPRKFVEHLLSGWDLVGHAFSMKLNVSKVHSEWRNNNNIRAM